MGLLRAVEIVSGIAFPLVSSKLGQDKELLVDPIGKPGALCLPDSLLNDAYSIIVPSLLCHPRFKIVEIVDNIRLLKAVDVVSGIAFPPFSSKLGQDKEFLVDLIGKPRALCLLDSLLNGVSSIIVLSPLCHPRFKIVEVADNISKALSLNPSLHSATLQSIHSIISFLQSKGIHQKDLGRIFGMCPKILTSDIKTDLNPVFTFLSQDLKVPDHSFRRVINKCPRFLVSSVRDQLKPALFYLQRLGFKDLEALAYQDPVLLVSSVEKTLIPKLNYLVSLGFSRDDAVGMVLRCPGLFTFSVENNFKPKFDYFAKEMEGKLEELKEFPQYFAFSLEKRIKPRHMEVVQSGVKIHLPLMLKSTDEEFRELIRNGGG
ncbi:hypothetical protein F0562_018072 [Nyssa sinensis]|uniref:Uncharacterized protein n=1 Tax=Nyssa sinensis TaxID=561372 RepID=A0A5J4Z891_9ASTE|nr:hypothetical protein F0562_018072 [Nyssa sinensis]